MRNSYGAVFSTPGAAGFSLLALVARLPMAMLGLAIMLLVSELTDSYAVAGAVSAVSMVAFIAATPPAGRLIDRYGQFRVLLPLAAVHLVGLGGLIVAAEADAPVWVLYVTGVVTGASRAPIGSIVRTRWRYVLNREGAPADRLQTAFALESTIDEVIYTLGPILVTWLATGVHYLAGLLACLVTGVGGTFALGLQRGTEPEVRRVGRTGGSPLRVRGMPFVVFVMVAFGVVIGSTDIVTVAYATAQGAKGASGLVLGAFAAGSMIAGVWYGARKWEISLRTRWNRCLVVFAAGLLPLSLPVVYADTGLVAIGVILFVSSFTISPMIITLMLVVEEIMTESVITEGMSWVATSSTGGIALGGWLGGWLADDLGAHRGYLLPLVAGVLTLLVGLILATRVVLADQKLGEGVRSA